GALLSVTSGTLGGSLIPPGDVVAPVSCWYLLRAPPGHRVELQLHRLVHIGTYNNGTTCNGGYVEVSDGITSEVQSGTDPGGGDSDDGGGGGLNTWRVCGEDQRLHPPAVLYSDTGAATLTYKVSSKQGSPRFMAYYNFPLKSNPNTGDLQRGGSRVEYTDCDWLYQDIHCRGSETCHLTSPGFPGLYPSSIRCRYLLAMSAKDIQATLTFLALDLPAERCAHNYIGVYAGTSSSSPLIATLCGSQRKTLTF
ncbi:unnamed protein product, partial [Meganyctiphanes norvegica]